MNLLQKLRQSPKKFGVMAVAGVLAVVGSAYVLAAGTWGPDRPTFTVEKPAPYVTFNSITNNPVDGDERNFVRAKPVDGSAALSDNVAVQPGKEYVVRMVVHNNAGDNLNLESINTRVKAAVPTHTGRSVDVTGHVTADNARPQQVWDSVRFSANEDFNLAYVAGSAKIYNQGYAKGGAALGDSIVTSAGAKIGYKQAGDGKIPGCFEYLSYVEFKVKPQFAQNANFEVAKTVSLNGKNTWQESVNANPGDLVDFRIKYKNTGDVAQNNIVVKDVLPAGLSYQAGTTMLYSTLYPQGKKMVDGVAKGGINIGHYAPNSTAYVMFTAKVTTAKHAPQGECGPRTIKNVAQVQTDYGSKEDDAKVVVLVECEEPPVKPEEPKTEQVCELETGKIITIKESEFDAEKHSRDLSDCDKKEEPPVQPEEPKTEEVCELETGDIITIDEGEFNSEKHSRDLSECDEVVVEEPRDDAPKDEETPEVIAATGPGAIIGGLFGSSALGLGLTSYLRSRRALMDIL